MRALAAGLALAGVALALAGCKPNTDVGYVELKTVPVMTNVTQPALSRAIQQLEGEVGGDRKSVV